MKYFAQVLGVLSLSALLVSCASNPQAAEYEREKNAPQFGNNRSFVENPQAVLRAARAALDELQRTSEPAVATSLSGTDDSVRTAWVYGLSKDKYLKYKANGLPQRKPLRVRRRYAITATPNLQGSLVVMDVAEESLALDLKTGEEKGWKNEPTDPAVYDLLTRRLKEKLRQQ